MKLQHFGLTFQGLVWKGTSRSRVCACCELMRFVARNDVQLVSLEWKLLGFGITRECKKRFAEFEEEQEGKTCGVEDEQPLTFDARHQVPVPSPTN